jgi:hypothetical protein
LDFRSATITTAISVIMAITATTVIAVIGNRTGGTENDARMKAHHAGFFMQPSKIGGYVSGPAGIIS